MSFPQLPVICRMQYNNGHGLSLLLLPVGGYSVISVCVKTCSCAEKCAKMF